MLQKIIFSSAFLLACLPAFAQNASQLDAVAGEYTDAKEPDTPLSFYVKDGKLTFESERQMPTVLTGVSETEFSLPHAHVAFKFGPAATLTITEQNGSAVELHRTGDAVHHVFHHYERREEMIPMRDGVKLHIVILTPTDIAGPLDRKSVV